MSKWQLLLNRKKSALNSIHRHVGFQLFNKVKVIWENWNFQYVFEFADSENEETLLKNRLSTLLTYWFDHIQVIDSSELFVKLIIVIIPIKHSVLYQKFVNEMEQVSLTLNNNLRITLNHFDSINNCIDSALPISLHMHITVTYPNMIPLFTSCKYYYYELPSILINTSMNGCGSGTNIDITVTNCNQCRPVLVYTRECEESNISAKRLTSHITCGVDNTGN